jgi:hypothetical protein
VSAPVPVFPVASSLSGAGGELVQSLTYREAYAPAALARPSSVYDPPAPRRHANAPDLFGRAAGAAWALVSIGAAGSVLVVLVLVLVRVIGWLA